MGEQDLTGNPLKNKQKKDKYTDEKKEKSIIKDLIGKKKRHEDEIETTKRTRIEDAEKSNNKKVSNKDRIGVPDTNKQRGDDIQEETEKSSNSNRVIEMKLPEDE